MELGEDEVIVDRVKNAGNLELQSISPSVKGILLRVKVNQPSPSNKHLPLNRTRTGPRANQQGYSVFGSIMQRPRYSQCPRLDTCT
jgi:hypothetical protein